MTLTLRKDGDSCGCEVSGVLDEPVTAFLALALCYDRGENIVGLKNFMLLHEVHIVLDHKILLHRGLEVKVPYVF